MERSRDKFVARQPIFDQSKMVMGYELLFRNGPENFFPRVDGTYASSRIIHDSIQVFGLSELASDRPIWVNVTREVLIRGVVHVLPPGSTTVEILESVNADDEVLEACRNLKRDGYTLALDDFVFRPGYEPLIELADVIKVDFLQTTGSARAEVVARYGKAGRRLLAEKVETNDEFAEAARLGYSLFQGYFFARPEIIRARDIPASKVNYLKLLNAVARREVDFEEIERELREAPALVVKLLRTLNSAAVGLSRKVTSIRQALVLLGEQSLRRWIALVGLTILADDKPDELVKTTLARARFCESLGLALGGGRLHHDFFLLGMLSMVDVIVGRPMMDVIETLGLTGEMRDALVAGQGSLASVLRLAIAYERGDWREAAAETSVLRLDDASIADGYKSAVHWSAQVFGV